MWVLKMKLEGKATSDPSQPATHSSEDRCHGLSGDLPLCGNLVSLTAQFSGVPCTQYIMFSFKKTKKHTKRPKVQFKETK